MQHFSQIARRVCTLVLFISSVKSFMNWNFLFMLDTALDMIFFSSFHKYIHVVHNLRKKHESYSLVKIKVPTKKLYVLQQLREIQ